jgi:hypothetical protein
MAKGAAFRSANISSISVASMVLMVTVPLTAHTSAFLSAAYSVVRGVRAGFLMGARDNALTAG